MSFRVDVHGRAPDTQQVTISHNGTYWTATTDSTGLVVMLPDPVGLVEAIADALSDDQRAHLREYLGGAR